MFDEHTIQILHAYEHFQFVRQATSPWPHKYRPDIRLGPEGTIIVAYSILHRGGIGRYWYVMATPDVVDGMQLDPGVVADPHGGLPVVPRSIASNEPTMPYVFCPEKALNAERAKRSAHVGYWELQRKLRPRVQEPPKPAGMLARFFSR